MHTGLREGDTDLLVKLRGHHDDRRIDAVRDESLNRVVAGEAAGHGMGIAHCIGDRDQFDVRNLASDAGVMPPHHAEPDDAQPDRHAVSPLLLLLECGVFLCLGCSTRRASRSATALASSVTRASLRAFPRTIAAAKSSVARMKR